MPYAVDNDRKANNGDSRTDDIIVRSLRSVLVACDSVIPIALLTLNKAQVSGSNSELEITPVTANFCG
ncbi:hypothetical protein J6590_049529 [Homalodisca vitripennis]|nr:hypothetical protein J6590_049529 [Homalodisca vitripennis]